MRVKATGPLRSELRNVGIGRAHHAAQRCCIALNSHSEDVVLRGPELSHFLGYCLLGDGDRLKPWHEVEACLDGSIAQRIGIADLAVRELSTDRCDATFRGWVERLLDDPEPNVRSIVSRAFWYPVFYEKPHAAEMLQIFAKSAAFAENLDGLLHGLTETATPITAFTETIWAIVDRLGQLASIPGSGIGLASHYLPDVLLRLYDQADHDPAARCRCLDIIDRTMEGRVSYEIVKAFDE